MYTYHSILTWCPGPKPNHKPDVLGSKLQKLVRQLDKTQNWYSFSPTTPPPKVIMSCSWYFKYLHTIVLGWPRNKLVEVASQAHRPAPSVVNLMATWVRASISSCTPRVLDNVCGLHSWSTVVSAAPENMKYEKQSLLSSFDLFRCQFFQCGLLMLSLTSRSGVIANILGRGIPLEYSACELEHQPNEEDWLDHIWNSKTN